MSAAPLLSVIVVCQHPRPSLPATLASVWEQRWVQPELIVVDCGSTHGTREWLEPQRVRLATIITLPADTGISAVLNAGLAAAHGEWVLFLEAGDRLVGEIILSESLNWMKKTEAGIAAGEVAYNSGRIAKLRSHVNPLAGNFLARAATFYRRSLFAENGGFDVSLAAMAGYELHLRLWKNRVRFKPIPLRIVAVETEPIFDRRAWAEEMRVRHRYFAAWRCWWWDALSVVRWARARFARALWP